MNDVPLSPDFIDAVGSPVARRLAADMRSWARAWGTPQLPQAIDILVNRRLRTSIARYRKDRGRIEVGPHLETPKIRREALAHELAHAAIAMRCTEAPLIHGPDWQALVRQAGFRPRTRVPLQAERTQAKRPRAFGYEHCCPVCHFKRFAKHPVTAWRCQQCVRTGLDGRLLITRT